MDDQAAPTSPERLFRSETARDRRISAARLQEIEGNPLTADEIVMFEMFEREGWSHERRRAFILVGAVASVA